MNPALLDVLAALIGKADATAWATRATQLVLVTFSAPSPHSVFAVVGRQDNEQCGRVLGVFREPKLRPARVILGRWDRERGYPNRSRDEWENWHAVWRSRQDFVQYSVTQGVVDTWVPGSTVYFCSLGGYWHMQLNRPTPPSPSY
jgi:hypothetical protein